MSDECPVCKAQKAPVESREDDTVKLKKLQVEQDEGKKL